MVVYKISGKSRLKVKRKIIIFVIDNKEFRTVQQSNVQHDMSESFKCLCFMEMLSLSTRDHNASAVDPGCFMVYNCFQFHVFFTNKKCRLLLRALCFTYCTSEVKLTLPSRLRKQILLSDRTRANVSFIFIIDRFETPVYNTNLFTSDLLI